MLAHRHGREIYQTSTMGALLDGVYDGEVTIRELLRHRNFGLSTFDGLDGEVLVLDGRCHQLRADGSAEPAHPDKLTPFAVVTWFHADDSFEVSAPCDRAALRGLLTIVDTDAIRYKVYWRNGRGQLSWHPRGELAIPRLDYGRRWP